MRQNCILAIFLLISIFVINYNISAQTYFGITYTNQGELYKFNVGCNCTNCCNEDLYSCCNSNFIFQTLPIGNAQAISPQGFLYGLNGDLYEIDTLTGSFSVFFDMPPEYPFLGGLIAIGNGIFYSMIDNIVGNGLLEINTVSGMVTNLGSDPVYPCHGDMCLSNEIVYYPTWVNNFGGNKGIASFSLSEPTSVTLVLNYPSGMTIRGLTATDYCNILLGIDVSADQMVIIDLMEGSVTPICNIPPSLGGITSLREFEVLECDILLDLDCDDNSGAMDADFNSPEFTCLSVGIPIADEDIKILYDFPILTMAVQIMGNIPDSPLEILDMTGSVPNISATGLGSEMITLTNDGGARASDFKDALHFIVYKDLAEPLTPGPRTVKVQFTTESGAMSNIATAFIEVNELPQTFVDLGSDQQACEGETATFDAGVPGAAYTWSTGSHNQSITVDESGEYIVTVTDGMNCPGHDTVELEILPIINVSLGGDAEICDNQSATLIIQTNTPFSLSVDIASDPGSPFSFPVVDGDFPFTDLPTQTTTYTITNVTSSQDACIVILDPTQVVEVHPTYVSTTDVALCDGDSIWLGFGWENEAGVYENVFNTYFGCDSTVSTTITILPAVQLSQSSTTCDSSASGVFISFLNNPTGCDTMVTTIVTLLPSDTTLINLLSCNQSHTGVASQTLTSQNGCDSLIITTTSWVPPSDTTFLFQMSCDSSLLGVSLQILPGMDGCDSLIITSTSMMPSDTTYLVGISCDSTSIGVFQSLFSNQSGCDSLVITTIGAGRPDTTLLFTTSCDSSSLGVFENHFTSAFGCDSTVIRTVSYSAQDSTFITSGSCDPSQVGDFVEILHNQFGCDSIVTETISLLPSDETFTTSSSCDPGQVGDFLVSLQNQFGCDSIVHLTVSLLPSSETLLTSTSCDPNQVGDFVEILHNQFGCDSIVTTTVSLTPADTTQLLSKTCDPSEVGSTQQLFSNHQGCDSIVISSISLFPTSQLEIEVTSDFNGYGVSCFGQSDGSATAHVVGTSPLSISWSGGLQGETITGLSAGNYSATLTDGNGCTVEESVNITEPEEFSIGFEVTQPDCFDQHEGAITIMQNGGVLPIRYSIDGINYQSSPTFPSLDAGAYTINAFDANDCEVQEIIWINVPLTVHVDLGQDREIHIGDTTMINAIVDIPFDSLSSITWSGLYNPNCPTCLAQLVAPIITTAYSISVTNSAGCSDADSVVVFVDHNIDIYVPNVFSPNDDGINDRLIIGAGPDVAVIEYFAIFDRWGNMVFLAEDFEAGDPNHAWDGKRDGVNLNPAVFAYRMVARFKDGRHEIRNGDVMLVR